MRTFAYIAAFLAIATPALAGEAQDAMNGTWISDLATVTIDWKAGTYDGVSLGDPFKLKITLTGEQANVVMFKTDTGTELVAQLGMDGKTIMITKKGGLPIRLTRTAQK